MEDREYILFLTIAVMAVFAFALSAMGRRWRRGFSEKPLAWLSALEKRTTVGRWILIVPVFFIIFVMRSHRQHELWLVVVVVGIIGGVANLLWELSVYARSEIEVRKRLSSR